VEASIAAAVGEYTFDLEALVAEALAMWPRSRFARYDGRLASFAVGQLQLLDEHGDDVLLVDLLTGGGGLDLERSEIAGAEFISWLTNRNDFPDGAVMLFNWSQDFMPLRPGMNAAELLAAYDQ